MGLLALILALTADIKAKNWGKAYAGFKAIMDYILGPQPMMACCEEDVGKVRTACQECIDTCTSAQDQHEAMMGTGLFAPDGHRIKLFLQLAAQFLPIILALFSPAPVAAKAK